MEVYFNYGDPIKSKRLAEAIAMPGGTGPICGFGSALINGNNITLYPYAVGDDNGANSDNFIDPTRYVIRDLIRNHYIPREEDSDPSKYRINFGIVAKDGVIYRSGESSIENIPIEGTRGTYNQVLVFAEHTHVNEPVQNMVSFKAYWNESDTDFFTLYKKSQDIYYPKLSEVRKPIVADDPIFNSEFSYDYLLNLVEGACDTYKDNQKSMVLVGIYGDGNNVISGQLEKFAIVPYAGKFPADLRYNSSIHSYFKEILTRIENFLGYDRIASITDPITGENKNFTSLIDYLNWITESKVSGISDQLKDISLPAGSIILYDGVDIPEGWEEYTQASGRVVIGYTAGGVSMTDTSGKSKTILAEIGSTYDPEKAEDKYSISIQGTELPKHYHGIGLVSGKSIHKNDESGAVITSFETRNKSLTDYSVSDITKGIMNGAVLSGANVTLNNNPTVESSKEKLILSKLPPSITLRYIKKKNTSS